MVQQEFRVRFPVGAKLLIGVVLLLLISVGFMTTSAALLLTEDKRAYTFQAQSNEALLAGREFASSTRRATEVLRLLLGNVRPGTPIGSTEAASIQVSMDNQSSLLGVSFWSVPADGSSARQMGAFTRTGSAKTGDDELRVAHESIASDLVRLRQTPIRLINLTRTGGQPLLGVALSDISSKDNAGGMPVAIGVLRPESIGQGDRTSRMSVVDVTDGRVLLDSDSAALYGRVNLIEDPLLKFASTSSLDSGTREYESHEGRFLGSFYKPGMNLVILTRAAWSDVMAATYLIVERFILLGVMAISAGIIFAIFFSRSLTRPIHRLFEAAQDVGRGNFNVSLAARSQDELGALTSAFTAMSKRIVELIQESVRKVALENELAIASTVQQKLLPPSETRDPRFEIRGFYQSATECGGDWWGFLDINGKLCVMIADATGHGLPSALITAAAQACVTTLGGFAKDSPSLLDSPSRMLEFGNQAIFGASKGGIQMTFFLGVIDLETRVLHYASAGHNPPWLLSLAGGNVKQKSLVATGSRLGENGSAQTYEEKKVQLEANDILFLYTDGAIEGMNLEGEQFGKNRLLKVVKEAAPSGPETLVARISEEVLAHSSGKALDDDVTLVALRLS